MWWPRRRPKKLKLRSSDHEQVDHGPALESVEPATADREDLDASSESQVPSHADGRALAEQKEGPSTSEQKPLADLLLELQLLEVAPNVTISSKEALSVVHDDVKAIYHALAPRNMLESLLARNLVALNSVSMELCRNALRSRGDADAMAVFVRLACKASSTMTATVEAYGRLKRDDRHEVQINNVNVEAGAQAIVGRVEVGNRRKDARPENPVTKRLANDIEDEAA